MFILRRVVAKVRRHLKPRIPAPWVREQALEGLREVQQYLHSDYHYAQSPSGGGVFRHIERLKDEEEYNNHFNGVA